MRKSSSRIDNSFLESQSLTLMNGNRPGRFQGILFKTTCDSLWNFLCFSVDTVFGIGPLFPGYCNRVLFVPAPHQDIVCTDRCNPSDFSVIIPFLSRRIILHKHDLSPFFQYQMLICWESIFGKIVFHLRRIGISPSFKRIEFAVIDLLSLIVMSCQRNISFGIIRIESGYISAIQSLQGSQIHLVIPDLIE